jgi:hypothetical protein
MQDYTNWTIEEIKTADFGDKRLNKRFGGLLNILSNAPNCSLPRACQSWKETIAAYRFFNHENVTANDILSCHQQSTLERIKNEKIVLIPQDTTEIDFTGRKAINGMGYLDTQKSQGFYLHLSLATTPERLCLGVIDFQSWTRKKLGIRKERHNKSIEEKETYCWLKGYEAANQIALAAPNTVIVNICDRGGDIYEVLEKMPSETNKAFWLIRSNMDRKTLTKKGDKELKLREIVRASKPIGKIEFNLPAGKVYNRTILKKRIARKERTVQQEVRACTVSLHPPPRKSKDLTSIAINVVHCIEIDPPNDEEKIEWFLLTSFPITNAEAAITIVRWYLCRWQAETFFKILKSGCTVEELQFESLRATTNCIAVYTIVAWRILHLTMLGRTCPNIECSAVFEPDEWQSVYAVATKKPPPINPPKLNEIILMIAKLGGFLGRKSDGYPGPQVMWIGLQRAQDFTLAWQTFNSIPKTYV